MRRNLKLLELDPYISNPKDHRKQSKPTTTSPYIEAVAYNADYYDYRTFETAEDLIAQWDDFAVTSAHIKWINVIGVSDEEQVARIAAHFNTPSLILEQIFSNTNLSTYTAHKDFLYNNLINLDIRYREHEIDIENVSIFFQPNLIITYQEYFPDVFINIREWIVDNRGKVRHEEDSYLYYLLLDKIVDEYLATMEIVQHQISMMESYVTNGKKIDVSSFQSMRTALMTMKLTVTPTRSLIEYLAQSTTNVMELDEHQYLADLLHHIEQVASDVALQREWLDAIYDNYILDSSSRQEDNIRVLTLFSTIFIPLSFLTGFYGMNFAHFPGINNGHAIPIFLGVCVTIVIALLVYFKKRDIL